MHLYLYFPRVFFLYLFFTFFKYLHECIRLYIIFYLFYWKNRYKLNWKLNKYCIVLFVLCLFGVYRPTQEFFTHLETSPLPVKGWIFYLCSALKAIEQRGFFSVPHLLWHGASVYNDHLQGPVNSHLLRSV